MTFSKEFRKILDKFLQKLLLKINDKLNYFLFEVLVLSAVFYPSDACLVSWQNQEKKPKIEAKEH